MTKQTYKDFLANNGEKKWQDVWYGSDLFHAQDISDKPKYYTLIEFPYPSGEGLHVGHPRSFTAMDIISRKRRMEGYNVLYPIGFDAFGLPAENFALKTGVHPKITTEKNIANFTRQLKALGFSFDWSRAIDTTEPGYYKWTQWIFSQLFKHGLAYKKNVAINYCTKDKVALANEEVVNGKCERCGSEVIQKEKDQWMLRITDYADRLDRDLDLVDFWDKIKIQQRNWVGKSTGAEITFKLNVPDQEAGKYSVTVFTTRPDTIYGVTFMAISPELAQKWLDIGWQASGEVQKYVTDEIVTRQKSATELGTEDAKEKTGIDTGIIAINPINGEEVPVWVVNYVLGNVGTGAIMGVPAHDERDYDFAEKYQLPIKEVVQPFFIVKTGSDAIRSDLPFSPRNIIAAIIKHQTNDEYLCIKWKKNNWHGFVTGGIEVGEDEIEAAIREIKEETGYQNIKFIKRVSHKIKSQFYHEIKEVNRDAQIQGLYFELEDETRTEIAEPERALHDLVWVKANDVQSFLNRQDMSYIWEAFQSSAKAFIGDGVLVSSGEFDGLEVETGKRKIVAKLKQLNHGHATTTYKLRDWVFSRQRYWGEPLPLIHCTQCATKKQKVLLVHGFEATGEYAWFPWMKAELEKQGFEVFAPTLPDSKNPDLSAWEQTLSEIVKDFDEDDIVVAHSLGAQAMMHVLAKMNNKIGHLFLVGNVPLNPTPEQWEATEKTWIGGRPGLDVLKAFMAEPINWRVATDRVGVATIAISRDDYIFGSEIDAFKKIIPAGWRYVVYEDQGHFSGEAEPELLELVSRAKVTGWRLVPELPLTLPEVDEFRPGADGESPLAALEDWINVPCPHCGGQAQRETDTMPQWAGSSWYFLRYIDPQNTDTFADPAKLQYWMTQNGERNHDGIDWYNGGMEHTTLHLLYSRFWHKFLYDLNFVPTAEPYAKRTSQGMILGEGGVKMSKSLGNVVNPDEIVTEYGADTMRLYEMFMGPFDQAIPWDPKSIIGVRRFLEKVWHNILTKSETESFDQNLSATLEQTIQKVSENIEDLKFNTAISALMILINSAEGATSLSREFKEKFLILLSPFAPHIVEELWEQLGHTESISLAAWPIADASKIIAIEITFAVQINGKVRGTITVAPEAVEADIIATAQKESNVAKYLEGKEIKKTIVVPGKLVSFVI